MLDHENEHEKALKTLASFPVSNLALHVYMFIANSHSKAFICLSFVQKNLPVTLSFRQCLILPEYKLL